MCQAQSCLVALSPRHDLSAGPAQPVHLAECVALAVEIQNKQVRTISATKETRGCQWRRRSADATGRTRSHHGMRGRSHGAGEVKCVLLRNVMRTFKECPNLRHQPMEQKIGAALVVTHRAAEVADTSDFISEINSYASEMHENSVQIRARGL